ncbi:hypothetical protein DYB38_003925 [Aphanomyces astaci]|uniref:Oxidoreductase n=1 Tax=Aphanomyces astaci TaxID=112090 RepID=A0A397CLH4_APHAT|nr:hypothetical protein DYB38_003925 [Aphanomyces astaci]
MDTTESGHVDEAAAESSTLLPFSDDKLAVCLEVLAAIATDMNVVELPAMRNFRKVLAPVSDYMESRKFKGKGRKKYLEDQELRREKEARNIKRKMNDHKYINSATLRRARVEKLNELLEQGKGEEENAFLPLIADGAADESAPTLLLEDGHRPAVVPKVELNKQRSCYTCKVRYEALHHFYDQLCPSTCYWGWSLATLRETSHTLSFVACAEVNYTKRMQSADLHGKVALVTGARVKIGYHTALKLLLAGATVIATSRFPHDTAERYAAHPELWYTSNLLMIEARDLVHLEHFLDHVLQTYTRLDVVVHNACQTIRRPTTYYAHMMPKEATPFAQLSPDVQTTVQQHHVFTDALHRHDAMLADGRKSAAATGATHMPSSIPSALKSQVPMLLEDHDMSSSLFPQGRTDVNGQQLDLRTTNSWVLKMGQVTTPEVAEVFAINTLAPFIMNSRLRALMEKTDAKAKYIVNVSAMEGKFYRYKTPNHPHTNSAWINDENPLEKAHKYAETANFQTPIDEIDAGIPARILDPVFVGYNTHKNAFGLFFKDYHETEW